MELKLKSRNANHGILVFVFGLSFTVWAHLKILDNPDNPDSPDNPVNFRISASVNEQDALHKFRM